MQFEWPWAFFLFLILPILEIYRRRKKAPSIMFSSIKLAKKMPVTWKIVFLNLPIFIRYIALSLIIIAVARPREGIEQIIEITKGIAIEMVVDRSGSMSEPFSENKNKLDVAKEVFKMFVKGDNKKLSGRASDLIGIIIFARYADTICPLTLAHDAVIKFVDSIKIVQRESEDGTAIGDALALAAARLKTVEDTIKNNPNKNSEYTIKSKIIILLTDGKNNCGKYSPIEAANLAKKWGIKIYTIGIGGASERIINTPVGKMRIPLHIDLDENILNEISKITGGIYQRADSPDALIKVYEEIDKLEKTSIEGIKYVNYKERFGSFVIPAFILLILEFIMKTIIFRKIP